MIKDRLAALRAAQEENDIEEVHINMDQTVFMAEFFNQVEDIRGNIDSIQNYVNEIKRLHSTILAAPTPDDKVKDELEERMAEIKKTAQKVRLKLKDIEAENSALDGSKKAAQTAEYRIRKLQSSWLSQYFTESMASYNAVQLEHRENCKKRIQRQLEITGKKTNEEDIEKMLESGNPQIFSEGVLMETKMAKQTLADIEARHQDIIKLEQSIKEIHDMFIDLALLIESQGEVIDSIETNMLSTLDYVEQGNIETKEAVRLQSSARRKKIIIIAILVIVVIIVIVVVLATVLPTLK